MSQPANSNSFNINNVLGQYATSAEIPLLSSIMNDTNISRILYALDSLEPDDFSIPEASAIFKALREVFIKTDKTNNILEIVSYLQKNDLLQQAGGIDYIGDVYQSIPTPSLTEDYVKKIKSESNKRKILLNINQIALSYLKGNYDNLSELLSQLEEIIHPEQGLKLKHSKLGDINHKVKLYCDLFPEGALSIIAGSGSVGKTYSAIGLCCHFIMKYKKPVFMWLSEDTDQVGFRIETILARQYDQTDSSYIRKNLHFIDEPPPLFFEHKFGTYSPVKSVFLRFKQNIIKHFDLIVLDPLVAFFNGNENDNSQADIFMKSFAKLIIHTNKSIVFLHHIAKMPISEEDKDNIEILKAAIRGAGSFVNSVRAVHFLYKTKKINDNQRSLVTVKSNVGREGKQTTITMPWKMETGGVE